MQKENYFNRYSIDLNLSSQGEESQVVFTGGTRQIPYQREREKRVWTKPEMGKARKHKPEQIVNVLRKMEVEWQTASPGLWWRGVTG